MSLNIDARTVEGVVILDLHGRLVAGPDVSAIRQKLDELAASASPNVILNLQHLHFIDSSGLGAIVAGYSAMQKAGGALKLVNVPKRSAELLVLTKLSTVLPIFEGEDAAIDSFFPAREVKRFDILDFVNSQESDPPKSK